jgi:hypothetical protein
MIAYKFLERGAIAPFTQFAWPSDGRWVDAGQACEGTGIHACRPSDLPYWVSDELWRVELSSPVREREEQVEATRGRLLERIARWDPRAFAAACAFRTRDLALGALGPAGEPLSRARDLDLLLTTARSLRDLDRFRAEMVGYVIDAAMRAREGHAGSASHTAAVAAVALRGSEAAFEEERQWQAGFLSRWLHIA